MSLPYILRKLALSVEAGDLAHALAVHRLEVDRDAARDVCDDLRQEIARLNAKIKRREVDLRRRYGSAPSIVRTPYEAELRSAQFASRQARARKRYRMARRLWGIDKAKAAFVVARALRLSDPSFAGRLP